MWNWEHAEKVGKLWIEIIALVNFTVSQNVCTQLEGGKFVLGNGNVRKLLLDMPYPIFEDLQQLWV